MKYILVLLLSIALFSCEKEEFDEINDMLRMSQRKNRNVLEDDIEHFPDLLKEYLIESNIVGSPFQNNVRFLYSGDFFYNNNWTATSAVTYVTLEPLSRNYLIEVNASTGKITGLDKYHNGEGRMSIRYFSGVSLMESDGAKLDTSELVNLIVDMPLAPSMFLSDKLEYEVESDSTLLVRIRDCGLTGVGTLYFNENNQLSKFIAHNRYKNESDPLPTKWVVLFGDYRLNNDLLLPHALKAYWEEDGKKEYYAKFKVSEVDYNINNHF